MYKKAGMILAAGIVTLALIAGCSKSGSSGGAGASGGAGSTGSANAPINISIWHYFEHEAEALNKLAADFNALHAAENVHLTATYMAREELMNQYTIGAVSGQLPDIGMVDSPDHASYIALGVFEDITDELKAWGQLDQFYPGPLSSTMDANGRIYGLPNNSNCLALACNMDLLNAAGIAKPTTWAEFEAACAKLTDPAESRYGFAMSAISNEEGTFQFIPWLYSAGGSVAQLDSPGSIRAMEFLAGLIQKGYMSKEVVNWGQGDAMNAFIAGKAAMVESGTWQIASDIIPKIGDSFKVEYTLLPKDAKYASVIGGENFGVCTGTKYRDICIEFLKYMETADNVAYWCEIAGKLPVRLDSSKLRDFWTADPYFAVFTEGMNYAVARGPHPEWPTISRAVYTAGQTVLLGEKSPADAMKAAADALAPVFAKTPIAQ
ncbi:MAG: extracellular solute-binding protein [Treponema sp.]|jgi:multiple sugar transport system substrate-binding protein|nr:extracellular solute-binding protein [Treponema sp.]